MIAPLLTPDEVDALSCVCYQMNAMPSPQPALLHSLFLKGYLTQDRALTSAGKEALMLHAIYRQIEAWLMGTARVFRCNSVPAMNKLALCLLQRYADFPTFHLDIAPSTAPDSDYCLCVWKLPKVQWLAPSLDRTIVMVGDGVR